MSGNEKLLGASVRRLMEESSKMRSLEWRAGSREAAAQWDDANAEANHIALLLGLRSLRQSR